MINSMTLTDFIFCDSWIDSTALDCQFVRHYIFYSWLILLKIDCCIKSIYGPYENNFLIISCVPAQLIIICCKNGFDRDFHSDV